MTKDEALKLCDYLECNDASLEAQCKAAAFIRNALAQRTWVGLTDEEIWTVLQFRGYSTNTIEIAKAIEAKLRSKNENR